VTQDTQAHHISLEVVKQPEAKKKFVLLPKRWQVERRNAWAVRFRRLAWDYEQLAKTLVVCFLWRSQSRCSKGSSSLWFIVYNAS
jgi:transposase